MEKNNLQANQTLGIAYENHKKGNLKLAKSLYEKVLKKDSNNFEAIFLLGSLFLQTRNFQEAIRYLNKGTLIQPKHANSYQNLGYAFVELGEFEKAKDKIMMGSERKSMVMDEAEKELTAFHEAGHAIVGRLVPEHDPVYKVSIIPRGRALGVTMFLPEKDKYSISKRKINSQIASLFGGRIAEELVYGKDAVTTGASNDIERATELAHKMVKLWGMSDVMGPLAYGEEEGEVFLGRQVTKHKHISDDTFNKVDTEIRIIIDTNYDIAYKILEENRDILDSMAAALIEFETIDTGQIDDLMARKPMREAAEVVDSEEVSSELGTGSKSKGSKPSSDDNRGGDSGTEQFA